MLIKFNEACEKLSIEEIDLVQWIDYLKGTAYMYAEVKSGYDKESGDYLNYEGYNVIYVPNKVLKSLFLSDDHSIRWHEGTNEKRRVIIYYANHIETLQIEIKLFELIKEELRIQQGINTVSEKERDSLLKIVLGMAIAKYGYKTGAKRNAATGEGDDSISKDLELNGLHTDPETIRKFIKEAAERFGDKLPSSAKK